MQVEDKRKFKAIHATDLSKILEKLNLLDDFTTGSISCIVCKDKISSDNMGSIKKIDNKIIFSCSKPSCYNEIVKPAQTL